MKGQKVTLTVGTGTDTKAVGALNTSTQGIDFKWEKVSQIVITNTSSTSNPRPI